MKPLLFALSLLFLAACAKGPDDESTTEAPAETAEQSTLALAGDGSLLGMKTGTAIAPHVAAGHLVAATIETGEGSFDVFEVYHEGVMLGWAYPTDQGTIASLQITHPMVRNFEGLGVGSTLGELRSVLGDVTINGSEIEGRTTANSQNERFLLDTYLFQYEVDESAVADSVKVRAIIL